MITKEIWVNYIVANLFKNNEFLEKCRREDQNVLAGKVVHIPQAGTKPEVVKNRGAITAAPIAVRRGDGDIVYLIDEYTTNAIVIPDAEKVELSYDKMASVLDEHISALMDTIGNEVIFNWISAFAAVSGQSSEAIAAATNVFTTGANVAAHIGTGTRKLFVKEDLQKARTLMNKQNVSREDRIALIDSEMLDQLMQDADLKRRDMALELDMKNGVINRLYGFEIIERSSVASFTAGVVKTPDDDAAPTDRAGVICFQKDCVEAALGEVKFFENPGDALYYGDVYSGLVRFGGRKRRRNAEGVVSIVQGV